MIELKVGDKFVVRSTVPEGCTQITSWNSGMDLYIGCTLRIKRINYFGNFEVFENNWTFHAGTHIDWEATKKLHEVGKTYEWHEAIKMAAEGTPIQAEGSNDYMELYNDVLHWFSVDGTVIKPVRVHQSDMWINTWIPYIKRITLTDDEKTILRNVDSRYKWITKDKGGDLFVYESRPIKEDMHWSSEDGSLKGIAAFNHLFQQIKWEDKEPCLIDDLIKG